VSFGDDKDRARCRGRHARDEVPVILGDVPVSKIRERGELENDDPVRAEVAGQEIAGTRSTYSPVSLGSCTVVSPTMNAGIQSIPLS
jgi:hypothetical protein